jgi:hypothetical protein
MGKYIGSAVNDGRHCCRQDDLIRVVYCGLGMPIDVSHDDDHLAQDWAGRSGPIPPIYFNAQSELSH